MAVRFVLDEQLRGELWNAILQHNARASASIDAVRVGDFPDLPLSARDSEILEWAAAAGRVLISRDRRTMIAELDAHLEARHSSPGSFIVRRGAPLADVLAFLAETALDDDEDA